MSIAVAVLVAILATTALVLGFTGRQQMGIDVDNENPAPEPGGNVT